MNYCCEAYTSLYVNSCRWRDHGEWPHAGCPSYSTQHHLLTKYPELLLEDPTAEFLKDTKLKPKADTCPFCDMCLLNTGKYPDVEQSNGREIVYAELADVPESRTPGVTRHIAQEPDWEVGGNLIRRLHEHARR